METLSTLRFGARARNIKNQPKVNKEYTVPELKRLLEKAEAEIDMQKCKVRALEQIIKGMGGELPREEDMQKMSEAIKEAEEEAAMAQETLPALPDISDYSKDIEEETPGVTLLDQELLQEKQDQIELLQSQLDKERERLRQLEINLANLREELDIQTAKCANMTQERDGFQRKLKDCIYQIQ
jgi:kinesin family member 5